MEPKELTPAGPRVKALKDLIFREFGCFPVLAVKEDWWIEPDEGQNWEPENLRDYFMYCDTAKLHLIDDHEVAYIEGILTGAADAHGRGRGAHVHTSKKYCFSDMEDWYEDLEADDLKDRFVFDVKVTLG